MDKLENWITWGLMFALLYQVSKPAQFEPVCPTPFGTDWGVTDALQTSNNTFGLSGYNGGCGCK